MKKFDRIDSHPHAKSFTFQGDNVGILLIHGFTGAPGHMLRLGESFHEDGHTVLGIQLPGHGTHLDDMEESTWQHWLAATRDAVNKLAETCDQIFVCGLSMGGVLTLLMAEELPITGAISIAAPVRIHDPLAPYAGFFGLFLRYRPYGKEKPDKHPYDIGYQATPLRKVPDLLRLMRMAESGLHKITCPMLIVQGLKDGTVKPKSAQMIHDLAVHCHEKEIIWLENSPHVCTLEPEYDILIDKIRGFIKGHSK